MTPAELAEYDGMRARIAELEALLREARDYISRSYPATTAELLDRIERAMDPDCLTFAERGSLNYLRLTARTAGGPAPGTTQPAAVDCEDCGKRMLGHYAEDARQLCIECEKAAVVAAPAPEQPAEAMWRITPGEVGHEFVPSTAKWISRPPGCGHIFTAADGFRSGCGLRESDPIHAAGRAAQPGGGDDGAH